MKTICLLVLVCLSVLSVNAQVEHVPVVHPVYDFLLHAETKGILPHYSHSSLPLQRSQIIEALTTVRKASGSLNNSEINSLNDFETEFEIKSRNNSVVIYSGSDSNQVLSSRFFSDDEKFIYRYKDSSHVANISPLGSFESIYKSTDLENDYVLYGNLGVRLFGTLGNRLGYYLQATNGAIISGEKQLALENAKMKQNVKFTDLNSDFDFSESHIRFQYDWFYTIIGRETRLLGSGLDQRMFISSNAPPFDALSMGVRFKSFEYRYTHGSLLGLPEDGHIVGVETDLRAKYTVQHRFALKPSWGEIAFWENIIYSERSFDLAYLNPLSFFKSLEHALRDRDNSIMGGDFTIRPVSGLQLKGTFLLDDIIFSKIGENYWSNKTAWNIAAIGALPGAFDIGLEYSRVEPYTFTHFKRQNSMTNDSLLYGSYIPPNSDMSTLKLFWWFGGRYPLIISMSYLRHGANEYDEEGNLIKNVGGDPNQTRRPYDPESGFEGDPETVEFLDGDLKKVYKVQVSSGWEFIRGFSLRGLYRLQSLNGDISHVLQIGLFFEDF